MITVVIATHRGAATLPATLEALARQEPPGADWRVVVVENGERDATESLVAAQAGRLPVRYLHEPRAGQNAARNRALAGLPDGLVAFTDDDVRPEPGWLAALAGAARRQPAFDLFGGAIVADWPREPPAWIRDWVDLSPVYAVTDPARAEGAIAADQVFSPNMAMRASLFAAGHRFNARIGPDGSIDYAMGSETELLLRLERLGVRAWHCRGAIVRHLVRPHQLEADWILARARRFGRGQRRLFRAAAPVPWGALAGAAWVRCRAVVAGDPRRRWQARWNLQYALGELDSARGRR